MPDQFPNDDTGDALRRLKANGDDFDKLRDIDFTVVFATNVAAEEFAAYFRELEFKVSVNKSDCVPELPWDVLVVKFMRPSHHDITNFEETLEDVASPLGGRNYGWGCVTHSTEH